MLDAEETYSEDAMEEDATEEFWVNESKVCERDCSDTEDDFPEVY